MTESKQPLEGSVYIATYECKTEPSEKDLSETEPPETGVKIGFTARPKKGKTPRDMVQRRMNRLNVIFDENAKNHIWKCYYRSKYYKSIEAYLTVYFFDKRDGRAINEKEKIDEETGGIIIKGTESQEHFNISLDDALKALKEVAEKIDDSQGKFIFPTQ